MNQRNTAVMDHDHATNHSEDIGPTDRTAKKLEQRLEA